ncbi:cytochrome P450 [Cyathus striatus]|nr:cytochrome P450 [Cyathus striatus]
MQACEVYRKHGTTILSSITFSGEIPTFWLSDADSIKTVSTDRAVFVKDVEAYETINIYGQNLVGTEGVEWKRHRTVAKTAFNEANNAFVWKETIRVASEWFNELDRSTKNTAEISVDLLHDFAQVTLLVISSAGFGRRVSWSEDRKTEPPPGHKVAFRPALASAIMSLIPKALTPVWIYALSERIHIPIVTSFLKETKESFEVLKYHMLDLVGLARDWVAGGRVKPMDAALLRNLVEANMTQEGDVNGRRLTDDELLSDIFVFLLAGHETTAHTLCFVIILLALYPDIQEKVFEEALRLWPNGAPTPNSHTSYKESMSRLEYTSAVFHEAVRLYPPVARMARHTLSDTRLKAKRFSTTSEGKIGSVKEITVPIKAGSIVILDTFGLHKNPIHWGDDVEEFKPSRFIDTDTYKWPRDAFIAFSAGHRTCIGQRFALTEGICVLASLIRRYKVLLPVDMNGKPFEQQKREMLKWKPGVTITPVNARVRFQPRH